MKKYNIGIIYPGEREFHNFNIKLPNNSTVQTVLEKTFAQWNSGSGLECKEFLDANVRNLSTNDIVHVENTYYQCMSYGWNVVTRQYVVKLENEVYELMRNNPKYTDNAWGALKEIMHQRNSKNESDM